MKTPIFRKEALERMGSPEQLDRLMTVTSLRGWVALGALGLVLAAALLWSLFGRIPVTVEGHGVLVRRGGLESVSAPVAGIVTVVCVEVGQPVEKGQEVARLLCAGTDDRNGTEVRVESPISGRVLHVDVFAGDPVQEQSTLLSVEATDSPLVAVVYVSAGDGYRVEADDLVRVAPGAGQTRGARHLQGRVARAGKWTAAQSHFLHSLRNPGWTSVMAAQGPLLEILVEQDPARPEWAGDMYYDGTPCQARITVATQRPIELVLPFLEQR